VSIQVLDDEGSATREHDTDHGHNHRRRCVFRRPLQLNIADIELVLITSAMGL